MKKELDYFQIEGAYGGNQDWFWDPMMRLGGCAAVTACDLCVYLALRFGRRDLYPFDLAALNRKDYIRFSRIMKPYLRPRAGGIDKLETYTEGFSAYLRDVSSDGGGFTFEEFPGFRPAEDAAEAVGLQIDSGMPAAFLLLHHQAAELSDYEWHWFLLTGYQRTEDGFLVKAVTYGEYQWLDFGQLWDTGREPRGGMVLVQPV